MKSFRIAIFAVFLICSSQAPGQTPGSADGQVRETAASEMRAWDAPNAEWVSIETFWQRYAQRRGGVTWGRRSDYPEYAKVAELDTLMIELASGPCLMEFFHERWRRANDVRRWHPAFNEYGGCAHVFQ